MGDIVGIRKIAINGEVGLRIRKNVPGKRIERTVSQNKVEEIAFPNSTEVEMRQ